MSAEADNRTFTALDFNPGDLGKRSNDRQEAEMQDTLIDDRQIYSLTDFLQNHTAHIAHLKETKTPEVLTINGQAEVVILDTETYQDLLERARSTEAIAAVRRIIARANTEHDVPITPEELARRTRVMDELTAETERLGLYR